jgi:hypothetical protein
MAVTQAVAITAQDALWAERMSRFSLKGFCGVSGRFLKIPPELSPRFQRFPLRSRIVRTIIARAGTSVAQDAQRGWFISDVPFEFSEVPRIFPEGLSGLPKRF